MAYRTVVLFVPGNTVTWNSEIEEDVSFQRHTLGEGPFVVRTVEVVQCTCGQTLDADRHAKSCWASQSPHPQIVTLQRGDEWIKGSWSGALFQLAPNGSSNG